MINPVNNNPQNEYQPPKGRITASEGTGEHFSLKSSGDDGTDNGGVIYEPSEEGKNAASSGSAAGSGKSTASPSGNGAPKGASDSSVEDDRLSEAASELWNNIRKVFISLFKNIKRIFGNLWESKPISEGLENSLTGSSGPEKTGSGSIEKDKSPDIKESASSGDINPGLKEDSLEALEQSRDSRIKKALEDGNRDEFRSLILEEGKKMPARNTGMLTTYNSKGRINEIDPSDENKILHGNRGVRKF